MHYKHYSSTQQDAYTETASPISISQEAGTDHQGRVPPGFLTGHVHSLLETRLFRHYSRDTRWQWAEHKPSQSLQCRWGKRTENT